MRALLAALAVVAEGLPALGGQATSASARTMLAAVVDQQSRPLVDVGLDDFVVTENGTPREILDVHVADYPIALVLDDRPEVSALLGSVRGAARRFAERVGERPIGLFRLTDGNHPLAGLDDNRAAVLAAVAELAPASTTAMPPLDTVGAAATLLKASGTPFSAIVIVAGSAVDASAPVRSELLPRILDSGAAVHVVQVQSSAAARDATTESDLLRVVADQSRGQFTTVYAGASLPAALDRLADRLAIELMVRYLVPPGPREGDAQAGVRIPGARVVGLGVR